MDLVLGDLLLVDQVVRANDRPLDRPVVLTDLGPQEVIVPLFRIKGFGMSRVTKLPDGRFQNLHKEVVYYLDLKEDRIIDTWDNPINGETVEVFHTHNNPVNSHCCTFSS